MLCTSYDDLVKYGNILANLHKGNITADSSAQEIAAASVGTKLDKNGKPIITSPKQGLEYSASLRKSKGLFADVSSGAAVNGDGAPVGDTPKATKPTGNASSGTDPQGNNTTAQTGGTNAPANGTSSTNTGNQTNNTTYSFDSQKVKNSVAALAAKNAGIPTNYWGEPIINNPEDARRYEEEYNKLRKNEDKILAAAAAGISVNKDGEPVFHSGYEQRLYTEIYEAAKLYVNTKKVEKEGVIIDEIKMNDNSTQKTAEYTNAQSYTVVPDDSPNAEKRGCMTETEYNFLVATVAGEAGDVSVSNCYGVASAILNASECKYDGDIVECLKNISWKFGKNYKNFVDENGNININGFGTQEAFEAAKRGVNAALYGTRAFPEEVQYWVGNYSFLEKNGLLNEYNAFNKFSTTFEESSSFIN